MIFIEKIQGNEWEANCYIVHNNSEAIIIDPGCNYNSITSKLSNLKPIAVLATHGHYDHIINVSKIQLDYNVPFFIHSDERKLIKHANFYLKLFHIEKTITIPVVNKIFNDLDSLNFEFVNLQVIHTPGHTEGSVCFFFDDNLFSGDLFLKNKIGRIDLPGGNSEKLKNSLKRIVDSFTDINIYPGHFDATTLHDQKNNNIELIKILQH